MNKRVPRNALVYNLRRLTEGRYRINPDPRENTALERYQVRRGQQDLVGWAWITPGVQGSFQFFECGTCGAQMWDVAEFEAHVEAHPESGRPAPRSESGRPRPSALRALDEPDPALPSAQLSFRIHRDPARGHGEAIITWRVAGSDRQTRTVTADPSTSPPDLEAWAYVTALQVLEREMNVTVYTPSEHVPRWHTGEFERFQPGIKENMAAADQLIRERGLRIVGFEKTR